MFDLYIYIYFQNNSTPSTISIFHCKYSTQQLFCDIRQVYLNPPIIITYGAPLGVGYLPNEFFTLKLGFCFTQAESGERKLFPPLIHFSPFLRSSILGRGDWQQSHAPRTAAAQRAQSAFAATSSNRCGAATRRPHQRCGAWAPGCSEARSTFPSLKAYLAPETPTSVRPAPCCPRWSSPRTPSLSLLLASTGSARVAYSFS